VLGRGNRIRGRLTAATLLVRISRISRLARFPRKKSSSRVERWLRCRGLVERIEGFDLIEVTDSVERIELIERIEILAAVSRRLSCWFGSVELLDYLDSLEKKAYGEQSGLFCS